VPPAQYANGVSYAAPEHATMQNAPAQGRLELSQGHDFINHQDSPHLQPGAFEAQDHHVQEPVQEAQEISLTVPDGATPGTKLQCTAPDGQELRLTVPEGVPPGSVMILSQDPVTKAWKCMAEPADAPAPAPAPAAPVPRPQAPPPQPQAQRVSPQPQPQPITSYAGPQVGSYMSHGPVAAYPGQGPVLHHTMHNVMSQPLPVNLSYVPPPMAGHTSVSTLPGQVDPARFNPPRQDPGMYFPPMHPGMQRPSHLHPVLDQRPSYTPPPVQTMEQQPSYVPMPQVFPQQPMMSLGFPQTSHGMQMGGHRASMPVLDPSLMGTSGKVMMTQTPSYVPPPMPMPQQNNPSWVPPVAVGAPQAHPVERGPSITTLPNGLQQPMMQPVLGQPPMGFMGHGPMMGGMPPQMAYTMPSLGFSQMSHGMPMGGPMGFPQPLAMPMGHPMMHPHPAMGSSSGPGGQQMMFGPGAPVMAHPQFMMGPPQPMGGMLPHGYGPPPMEGLVGMRGMPMQGMGPGMPPMQHYQPPPFHQRQQPQQHQQQQSGQEGPIPPMM